MMSRKDYVKTSKILLETLMEVDDVIYGETVNRFADYFASDNPNFNRTRFFEACELDENYYRLDNK